MASNPNTRSSFLRRSGVMFTAAASFATLNACTIEGSDSAATIPDSTTTTTSTQQERLNDLLGVDDLAGPTSVTWVSCPPGGEELKGNTRVNAWNDGEEAPNNYTEIEEVHRYRDEAGRIIAWCGKSVGTQLEYSIDGPPKGMLVVIPADPSCPQPESVPAILPCPGMAVEYDFPVNGPTNGTFDLDIEVGGESPTTTA